MSTPEWPRAGTRSTLTLYAWAVRDEIADAGACGITNDPSNAVEQVVAQLQESPVGAYGSVTKVLCNLTTWKHRYDRTITRVWKTDGGIAMRGGPVSGGGL